MRGKKLINKIDAFIEILYNLSHSERSHSGGIFSFLKVAMATTQIYELDFDKNIECIH